jgi:4a-hydroxytetrahydrobiopterin dehydratase
MERLSDSEIDERLAALSPDWQREGATIARDLELAGFTAAIAFVNAVAALAEEANHHPDLLIHDSKRVRLTLSTHAAGGLTEHDFALAGAIDALS